MYMYMYNICMMCHTLYILYIFFTFQQQTLSQEAMIVAWRQSLIHVHVLYLACTQLHVHVGHHEQCTMYVVKYEETQ